MDAPVDSSGLRMLSLMNTFHIKMGEFRLPTIEPDTSQFTLDSLWSACSSTRCPKHNNFPRGEDRLESPAPQIRDPIKQHSWEADAWNSQGSKRIPMTAFNLLACQRCSCDYLDMNSFVKSYTDWLAY
jgi:hypothetical protein